MNLFGYSKLKGIKKVTLAIFLLGTMNACTTTDPQTGEKKIDYTSTAAAGGLALGAAALGVAISNSGDDKRDVVYVNGSRNGYRNTGYRTTSGSRLNNRSTYPSYRPYNNGGNIPARNGYYKDRKPGKLRR